MWMIMEIFFSWSNLFFLDQGRVRVYLVLAINQKISEIFFFSYTFDSCSNNWESQSTNYHFFDAAKSPEQ